eukprot:scaffold61917_cov59-Phaeocystis_antarctica.AAC.2
MGEPLPPLSRSVRKWCGPCGRRDCSSRRPIDLPLTEASLKGEAQASPGSSASRLQRWTSGQLAGAAASWASSAATPEGQ